MLPKYVVYTPIKEGNTVKLFPSKSMCHTRNYISALLFLREGSFKALPSLSKKRRPKLQAIFQISHGNITHDQSFKDKGHSKA